MDVWTWLTELGPIGALLVGIVLVAGIQAVRDVLVRALTRGTVDAAQLVATEVAELEARVAELEQVVEQHEARLYPEGGAYRAPFIPVDAEPRVRLVDGEVVEVEVDAGGLTERERREARQGRG